MLQFCLFLDLLLQITNVLLQAANDVRLVLSYELRPVTDLSHLFLQLINLAVTLIDFCILLLYHAFIFENKVRNLFVQLTDLSYILLVQLAHTLKHGHGDLLVLGDVVLAILRDLCQLFDHGLFIRQIRLEVDNLLCLRMHSLAMLLS